MFLLSVLVNKCLKVMDNEWLTRRYGKKYNILLFRCPQNRITFQCFTFWNKIAVCWTTIHLTRN